MTQPGGGRSLSDIGWRRTVGRLVVIATCVVGLPAVVPAPDALAAAASSPITYVYDDIGRLEAVIDASQTNGLARYLYDGVGNLTQITRTAISTTPLIVDFHPHRIATGNPITIYGTGFSATPSQNVVTFTGGATATATASTATTATVTVPSQAQGGTIKIKNTATKKTSTLSSQSWSAPAAAPQVSAMTPAQALGGATITLSGSGFGTSSDEILVRVNGVVARVLSVSSSTITFEAPRNAMAGEVTVRTPNGTASAPVDLALPVSMAKYAVGTPWSYPDPPYDQVLRLSTGTHQLTLGAAQDSILALLRVERGQSFTVAYAATGSVHTDGWDPSGTQFSSAFTGGTLPYVATQGGDHAILIRRYLAVGSVTITVTVGVSDVQDKGLVSATAVPGTLVSFARSIAGESGRLTFAGTADRCYEVDTEADFGLGGAGRVFVYRPSRPQGGARELVVGGDGYYTALAGAGDGFLAPETGTYTAMFAPDVDQDPSATVKLRVIDHGACTAGQAAVPEPDPGFTADGLTDQIDDVLDGFVPVGDASWSPDPQDPSAWWMGAEASPLEDVSLEDAPAGATALAGRVLLLHGGPLEGAAVSVGSVRATTDRAGRFLLAEVPTGRVELVVDGLPASTAEATYGVFEIGVDVGPGVTNELGYTVWMPALDLSSEVHIDTYPLAEELVIENPTMPGFEVHVPAGSTIVDDDGEPVHDVTLTPVPLDRPPFPGPELNEFTMHFTLQPGDAYVEPNGFRVVYANTTELPPGYVGTVWEYEPDHGWEDYGTATVTPDGSQIVPEPGARVYGFQGASLAAMLLAESDPLCDLLGGVFCSEDPINYANGLFDHRETDLRVPGTPPLELTRVFRQNDVTRYDHGQGMATTYDHRLTSEDISQGAVLGVPGGERVTFEPVPEPDGSPGIGMPMVATSGGPEWIGAELDGLGDYDIVRRDGTRFVFSGSYLTEVRDRHGNRTVIRRDLTHRARWIQSAPSGRWIELVYDAEDRVAQARDPSGRTVTYAYEEPINGMHRLTEVTHPVQPGLATASTTTYDWNESTTICASGAPCTPSPATYLQEIRDPENHLRFLADPETLPSVSTEYDAQGRAWRQTFANSATYTLDYGSSDPACAGGTLATDPNGNRTCAITTADGRPSSLTTALGTAVERTASYTFDPGSKALTTIQETFKLPGGGTKSRTTDYRYDERGNLDRVRYLVGTASPKVWLYAYDPGTSAISKITDPLAHERRFTYSYPQGCLTRIEDDLAHGVTLTCTETGQPKRITDDLGNQTTLTYASGDPVKITGPLGTSVSRFTPASGLPRVLSDPLGYPTTLAYDALGRLTKTSPPLGSSTSFRYDTSSNLTRITLDANGAQTNYVYDELNLVETRTDPLGRSETFAYDPSGNLQRLTDRRGTKTDYCYDAQGLVSFIGYGATGAPSCGSGFTSTTSFTHDGAGRLIQVDDSRAGVITRTFDDLDRLTNETTPQGSIAYTYDDANRRQTMTVAGQPAVNYDYWRNDLPKTLTRGTNVVTLAYDAANRPDTTTLPNGVVEDWSFDAAGRMTGATYQKPGQTSLGALSYGYDAAGRRTTVWGASSRITLPGATSVAVYDAASQLKTWNGTALDYDNNGNLKSNGTQKLFYDERNQLCLVTTGTSTACPGAGQPLPSGGLASYQYDGLGRRFEKNIGGAFTRSLYDGPNVAQELNSSNVPTFNLITGLAPDQVFWRSGGTNATTDAVLTDALGSTLATTTPVATPAIRTSFTYEPFGKPNSSAFPYLFTGRDYDATTGLQYNRTRTYAPAYGRFTSEDPVGILGGSANPYLYAANAPTVFTDPFGLEPGGLGLSGLFESLFGSVLPWLESVGAFIGNVAGYASLVVGLVALFIPGLQPLAFYIAVTSIVGYGGASVAAVAQGRWEAGAFYYVQGVLQALGLGVGGELAGMGGAALGAGLVHSGFDFSLQCALQGCGTYDPYSP